MLFNIGDIPPLRQATRRWRLFVNAHTFMVIGDTAAPEDIDWP